MGLAKENPLPGCCGACCGKMGMFISWIFPFFSEVKIEGCQQMLHMPILDVNMVPFDCAVVYRPRPETLAVVYFVRSMNEATIVDKLPMGPKSRAQLKNLLLRKASKVLLLAMQKINTVLFQHSLISIINYILKNITQYYFNNYNN